MAKFDAVKFPLIVRENYPISGTVSIVDDNAQVIMTGPNAVIARQFAMAVVGDYNDRYMKVLADALKS